MLIFYAGTISALELSDNKFSSQGSVEGRPYELQNHLQYYWQTYDRQDNGICRKLWEQCRPKNYLDNMGETIDS